MDGGSSAELDWDEPLEPGGQIPLYHVLRGLESGNFGSAICLDVTDQTSASDAELPAPGGVYYYLVRASNGCPAGDGSLGQDSLGLERAGTDCD